VAASGRGTALVLDVDTRAGLCCVRSLARADVDVAAGARDAHASGMRTRCASRRVILPDPRVDFDAHAAAILAEVQANPVDAVLSSIDSSVEALHRRRDEIGRFASVALGSPEAVEIALSKTRTLEIASALGIASPRSVRAVTAQELEAAAVETGFPCVFKPETSWRPVGEGGERLGPVPVADAEEARTVGSALIEIGVPVLVQQLVRGVRETVKLFRVEGKTVAVLAMSIDRAWPPLGGSSVMRRTVAPPDDVHSAAERLVAEIGLDGYSEVEFRRDDEGRALLMEVNPRLSQSVELAVRAGVDFPRMQFEWARGGQVPSPAAPVLGLRVGWPAGDLRLLVSSLRGAAPDGRGPGGLVRAFADDYLVHRARLEGLDLHDLRPALGGIAFAFGRIAARSESPGR
jgi:predicted ATP-grasp superfamily ATP-dependent carboligase